MDVMIAFHPYILDVANPVELYVLLHIVKDTSKHEALIKARILRQSKLSEDEFDRAINTLQIKGLIEREGDGFGFTIKDGIFSTIKPI